MRQITIKLPLTDIRRVTSRKQSLRRNHHRVKWKHISNSLDENIWKLDSSALSSQDSSVKMTPLKANCFALDPKEENPVWTWTIAYFISSCFSKLPDLDIQPFIMERIINLNVFHEKQAVYQGLHGANDINRGETVHVFKEYRYKLTSRESFIYHCKWWYHLSSSQTKFIIYENNECDHWALMELC